MKIFNPSIRRGFIRSLLLSSLTLAALSAVTELVIAEPDYVLSGAKNKAKKKVQRRTLRPISGVIKATSIQTDALTDVVSPGRRSFSTKSDSFNSNAGFNVPASFIGTDKAPNLSGIGLNTSSSQDKAPSNGSVDSGSGGGSGFMSSSDFNNLQIPTSGFVYSGQGTPDSATEDPTPTDAPTPTSAPQPAAESAEMTSFTVDYDGVIYTVMTNDGAIFKNGNQIGTFDVNTGNYSIDENNPPNSNLLNLTGAIVTARTQMGSKVEATISLLYPSYEYLKEMFVQGFNYADAHDRNDQAGMDAAYKAAEAVIQNAVAKGWITGPASLHINQTSENTYLYGPFPSDNINLLNMTITLAMVKHVGPGTPVPGSLPDCSYGGFPSDMGCCYGNIVSGYFGVQISMPDCSYKKVNIDGPNILLSAEQLRCAASCQGFKVYGDTSMCTCAGAPMPTPAPQPQCSTLGASVLTLTVEYNGGTYTIDGNGNIWEGGQPAGTFNGNSGYYTYTPGDPDTTGYLQDIVGAVVTARTRRGSVVTTTMGGSGSCDYGYVRTLFVQGFNYADAHDRCDQTGMDAAYNEVLRYTTNITTTGNMYSYGSDKCQITLTLN